MKLIRQAAKEDLQRIAEIEVFNYRLHFYPIFQDDAFYFQELTVAGLAARYEKDFSRFYVYDDGAVKGFIRISGQEVEKLFVEPVLQNHSIGSRLLLFAVNNHQADRLWALQKNTAAIRFYERHGFQATTQTKYEEGTTELLVLLKRETH